MALADSASDEGWCWPSLKTIGEKARQPERTVYQSIKNLIESGWLEKHPRPDEKRMYFRVVTPAMVAGNGSAPTATIAKKTATIAKPPHPLKGRTVIKPSGKVRAPRKAVAVANTILPAWLDRETWDGFREMRKRIGHPATPLAEKLILDKLQGFEAKGIRSKEVLERSIVNGWRDVFAPDGGSRQPVAPVKLVDTVFAR
jgi:hypothetical protein